MRRRPSRLLAALVVTALTGGIALAAGAPAAADSIDNRRHAAEARQRANAKARAAAEDAMEGISANLQATSDRLLQIQSEIPAAQIALDTAQLAYTKAQRESAIITGRLQDAQDQQGQISASIKQDTDKAAQARVAIGQMARQAYRGGGQVSGVDLVLDATSMQDFVQRYGMMNAALRTQSKVLDSLKTAEATNKNAQVRLDAVHDRIGELKTEADQKVAETRSTKKAAQNARNALDQLVAEQKTKQASLEAQKAEVLNEIRQADAEAKKIQTELLAAIAAQRARDAAEAAKNHGKGGGTNVIVKGAVFANPTATHPIYVTSEYGMRFHPILHYWRLHAGIDLRDHCGQPVYAGRTGTVLWAQARYGFGNQVMITHGTVNGRSLASSYNHLTRWVVHAGQHVSTGQLIGYAGNTGTSAACHLHFEVYVNGATTNPRPYLGI